MAAERLRDVREVNGPPIHCAARPAVSRPASPASHSAGRAATVTGATTAGAHAELVRGMDGRQTGDPAKAAQVILGLPQLDEPPLHLLLGSDAYRYVTESDRARMESDVKWRQLTESIDYDTEGSAS